MDDIIVFLIKAIVLYLVGYGFIDRIYKAVEYRWLAKAYVEMLDKKPEVLKEMEKFDKEFLERTVKH